VIPTYSREHGKEGCRHAQSRNKLPDSDVQDAILPEGDVPDESAVKSRLR